MFPSHYVNLFYPVFKRTVFLESFKKTCIYLKNVFIELQGLDTQRWKKKGGGVSLLALTEFIVWQLYI